MNKDIKEYAVMLCAAAVVLCAVIVVGTVATASDVTYMPGVDEDTAASFIQVRGTVWMQETHGAQGVALGSLRGVLSVSPAARTLALFPTIEGADVRAVVTLCGPDGQSAQTQRQFSHAELEDHQYDPATGAFLPANYDLGDPFGVASSGVYTVTVSMMHCIDGQWVDIRHDHGDEEVLISTCVVVVP